VRSISSIVYAVAALLPAILLLGSVFVADSDTFFLLGEVAIGATWLACGLYVFFALRSPTVPNEKRKLWVAVIVLGNAFALPFFWFWYVLQASRVRNA